jgi:hypothetical protein
LGKDKKARRVREMGWSKQKESSQQISDQQSSTKEKREKRKREQRPPQQLSVIKSPISFEQSESVSIPFHLIMRIFYTNPVCILSTM